MSTHNLCFEQKYEKYQNFLSENFHFLVIKFSVHLYRCVFVMIFLYTSLIWSYIIPYNLRHNNDEARLLSLTGFFFLIGLNKLGF